MLSITYRRAVHTVKRWHQSDSWLQGGVSGDGGFRGTSELRHYFRKRKKLTKTKPDDVHTDLHYYFTL